MTVQKWTFGLLALLLMGSASLLAQTGAPFGEVDDAKYSNTMTITGYVYMSTILNGQWSMVGDQPLDNETVVAVYCGDELRGKGTPADYNNKYFSLLMMTVYGEDNDKLYFKVFVPGDSQSPGRVIEVDQGVTFITDNRLGKVMEPYFLYLPAPVTTTFTPEGWATTCLPFNAEVPKGITVWNVAGIEDSKLVMTSVRADGDSPLILPANTPVLLQYKASVELTCEWLSCLEEPSSIFNQSSFFKGTIEEKGIAANSVLTLGHSIETGEIGFWLYTETALPANCAYITDFPSGINGARFLDDDGGTTDIDEFQNLKLQSSNDVYDLQGRRMESSMLKKGIYIVNGKKIVK